MNHSNDSLRDDEADHTHSVRATTSKRSENGDLTIQKPPQSWRQRLMWLGPGLTWMAAGAGGAGELLFPPRVGSLYGYALLWAIITAVILKWFINREIGRLAVCTGATLLDGFKQLPGPRNWAIWLILVPQLLVSVTAIAGLAGSAATALILFLPGDTRFWMIVTLLTTMGFLLWGHYKTLERVATVLAAVLALVAIITAMSVFPDLNSLAAGLVPQIPNNVDYSEIVPWLSFVLAGAAGMTWYSYWVVAKGYGAAQQASQPGQMLEPNSLSSHDRRYLRGWLTEMTLDITIGVIGGLLIVLAFLILGTELLRPKGLLPEEDRVAEVLGQLLGGVWGPVGFWFMTAAVLAGFWQTTLTNQDGWARLFADGTNILLQPLNVRDRWRSEAFLRRVYIVGLLTVLPAALYLAVGEPVGLLKLAGGIEAAHIPVIAWLTLYLNRRLLPRELRPSTWAFAGTAIAGLFFAVFAVVYVLQLLNFSPSSG